MIAFDRDGVLVGVLGDFEASHPGKYRGNNGEMPLIAPVVGKIAQMGEPVICISNQAGIKYGYTTEAKVIEQFRWLMRQIPLLKGCVFCPDEGNLCVIVPKGEPIFEVFCSEPIYRKPGPGMGKQACAYFDCDISLYVGDLSGRPDYGGGRDSDLQFAQNVGCKYLDVQDYVSA